MAASLAQIIKTERFARTGKLIIPALRWPRRRTADSLFKLEDEGRLPKIPI